VLPASHSLLFRVHTRVFVTLLVALAVTSLVWAEPVSPRALVREAGEAAKAGDAATAIAKLEAARALRPDYPRARLNLARTYAAAGRTAEALAELEALAAMGLAVDPARDAALASLGREPAFSALQARFAANAAPQGEAAAVFSLPGATGLIEGIAHHAAEATWYFADVRERCVWRRAASGEVSRFSPPADALLGVFDVKIDEARNALWIATALLPEVAGYTAADAGRAELVEYDLGTAQVRRRLPLPVAATGRALGSLALAADGTVYATDSIANEIWRVAPGAAAAELAFASARFASLQGLALLDRDRTLLVADYGNGLWRVDLGTGAITLLPAPAGVTLFGLDGLAAVPGGLVGIQNGIAPARIVRIALDAAGRPDGLTVLAAALPGLGEPTLGAVTAEGFVFAADAGWALFADPAAAPAARTVAFLRTRLD